LAKNHNRTLVRWQTNRVYRSNKCARKAERRRAGLVLDVKLLLGYQAVTVQKIDRKGQDKPPAPVLSGAPDRALEVKVKKHPEDEDAKVDLGSDESMDASDPISTTQPGSSEPAPSSAYPEKKTGD
jgi:hypothetical protein